MFIQCWAAWRGGGEVPPNFNFVFSPLSGGSTPPGITAPTVPSIPSPIGVNGFNGLPPQANGQPTAEAVFANGIHPYPAPSPTRAPLFIAECDIRCYGISLWLV
uniref:Uncharacterized protein n=1 Tax=Anas platyrhynchos TaxID=8839 RepID=A0A8B9ZIC4_ANAPL